MSDPASAAPCSVHASWCWLPGLWEAAGRPCISLLVSLLALPLTWDCQILSVLMCHALISMGKLQEVVSDRKAR